MISLEAGVRRRFRHTAPAAYRSSCSRCQASTVNADTGRDPGEETAPEREYPTDRYRDQRGERREDEDPAQGDEVGSVGKTVSEADAHHRDHEHQDGAGRRTPDDEHEKLRRRDHSTADRLSEQGRDRAVRELATDDPAECHGEGDEPARRGDLGDDIRQQRPALVPAERGEPGDDLVVS
jgi:hypothetical protein